MHVATCAHICKVCVRQMDLYGYNSNIELILKLLFNLFPDQCTCCLQAMMYASKPYTSIHLR